MWWGRTTKWRMGIKAIWVINIANQITTMNPNDLIICNKTKYQKQNYLLYVICILGEWQRWYGNKRMITLYINVELRILFLLFVIVEN
jgi:hypothetical protein